MDVAGIDTQQNLRTSDVQQLSYSRIFEYKNVVFVQQMWLWKYIFSYIEVDLVHFQLVMYSLLHKKNKPKNNTEHD